MQNSGRMPSFIATRRCLIYVKLPTIKCLCVCTHSPGAAHRAGVEPCAGHRVHSAWGPCTTPAVSCCKGAMNTPWSESLMEILSALKHRNEDVKHHRPMAQNFSQNHWVYIAARVSSMRSAVWPKREMSRWEELGRKVLWGNTSPCSSIGEAVLFRGTDALRLHRAHHLWTTNNALVHFQCSHSANS